jgi:hypothetical protein
MLLTAGTLDAAGEPAAETVGRPARDTVRPVPETARPAMPEPSWGLVLATTIKLWVLRRWRIIVAVAVAAAVAVTALAFSGAFSAAATPAARARPAGQPVTPRTSTRAAATPQAEAAAWIASQVSGDAIIACDPTTCTALQAQGVSAGRLMPLKAGSPDPQGAALVMTSASALSQNAPAVIASFGSGDSRLYVQPAEPAGAAAYQSALRSDLAARVSAGSQLLRNKQITFTAQDAVALRAGEVDTRVLATLAALSSQQSFTVAGFADASPGAAVLYREVTITDGSAVTATAGLTADLALVNAQVQPYLPAHAAISHPAAGPVALNIEYTAPSPLGLLTAVLDGARSVG